MNPCPVEIHYLRPPDQLTVYRQELIHDDGRVKVTLARAVELREPLHAGGRTILEPGADALWFTFPGAWHDIGRFHLADGSFTGLYANMITPCRFSPGGVWHTEDLFLDLWLARDEATPLLLDEAELEEAERSGALSSALAARARAEADVLMAETRAGRWPPDIVRAWTLDHAKAFLPE